jgi:cytidylate kinase
MPPDIEPTDAHFPVVTIAALAGAAGSAIGVRVADTLGVPFLDRGVTRSVADRTGLPEAAVDEAGERPRTLTQRAVAAMGRASTPAGAGSAGAELDVDERALRAHIEEFLARSTSEGGVAMGRGGMVVLRSVPWALHVHLGGPREGRVARHMADSGLDRVTAAAQVEKEDRGRVSYVRRTYGVHGEDCRLYHLMLDTVALDVDTSVDVIVAAARHRAAHPTTMPAV